MMKKITFLFFLLTVSLGYSQTFPLDFSNSGDAFTWDPSGVGGAAIINTVSEKLEIVGNGNDWDNAYINFAGADVVDLSNNAANTITFTMQSTTAPADEVHTHVIKLTTTLGVHQVEFTTTGPVEKTVFIDPPNALGNLTELRIFVDAKDGGNNGTGSYLIDNINLFVDSEAPTAFTASLGTIGAFGVEFLLNATDNSGTVKYEISYNDGVSTNTVQTTGASGVEKSFIAPLNPDTAYTFEVSASDATGNTALNNPITGLGATTISDTSTPCEGISNVALQGSFLYGYKIETISDTQATITITVLTSGLTGLGAGQLKNTSTSVFTNMVRTGDTFVGTVIFTAAVAPLKNSFSAFFPFPAGQQSLETKPLEFLTGECPISLSTNDFEIASLKLFPNPTKGSWNVISKNINISSIQVFDVLGKNVLSLKPNASEVTIDGSSLKAGLYFAQIKTASGVSSLKLIKN